MRSTPLLTEAKPVGGTVSVRFEDGTSGEVDLSYLLDYGGVFEPLRYPGYFRGLRADPEAGTIVWPNEADIAPGDPLRAGPRAHGRHHVAHLRPDPAHPPCRPP